MNSELEKNNYILLPKLIDPERAKHLSNEYESYSEFYDLKGDLQAPNSRSMYNWKGALELLCELTPDISKFAGTTLLPAYSYIRVYQSGDDLKRHRDRPSCEVSITLNLGGDCDWPIYIERPDGSIASILLQPGDAILYLGCKADHWREIIPGNKCIQVFLHYVESNGPNFDFYFDKQLTGMDHLKNKMTVPRINIAPEFIDYSQMPRNIKDFVKVFDNAISTDLCDRIIEEYKDDDNWRPAEVGQGGINDSIRKVNIVKIDDPVVMYKNFDTRQKLSFEMTESIFFAIQKYKQIAPAMLAESNSGYDLLRYQEGDFYTEHTDSFSVHPRHVSCSFHLNDVYEGGEFSFFNRELKFKPKKGSLIMFPSNFMFPHEILPVTKGTRYSIITWII
jgi:Rps23 Pro-64 3,4-dihydroxylase Tpa1-like proline 4-hydroxylase